MKKLSLLIFYKDYQSFLEEIRERGVVHVHENKERSANDEHLLAKLMLIKQLKEMEQKLGGRLNAEKAGKADVEDGHLLEHLKRKYHRQEHILSQLGGLQKEVAMYEPWGDFSEEIVRRIEASGWQIRFYSVPEQKFKSEWEENPDLILIRNYKGHSYFLVVSPVGENLDIEADLFIFPERSKADLLNEMRQLQTEYDTNEYYLDHVAANASMRLAVQRERVLEQADELHVKHASQALVMEKVIALEGWIPEDKEEELKEFLLTKDVYFELNRPTPEDSVPVLLKNGRFSRLFEPIGDMYDLPNYRELDLTPFFAPFYMLFFGLCMGDGGYGLLIWLACVLLKRKVAPKMKRYLKLGEYLGLSTMLVGIVTGSFFGMSLDAVTWPWLQGVKQYFLTEGNYGKYLGGYNPMMFVAFALGGIQILFAMVLNVVKRTKQFGFKYAVSDLGWVVLLLSLLVTFGLPALGIVFSQAVTYVLYGIMGVCALAIVFMNSPDKNIFVNVGSAVWNTYNMASGLLGDILSYVRLFALGLTGSILGGVFNMLAFDMTEGLHVVVRFVVAFLILLVGHSLNFVIAMIGAFVHPMRLTFVEFYKNAGFEGMGKRYSPFRKRVD